MSKYLGTINVTPEGFKGIVGNPQNRQEVNTPLFNSLGFEIEHYWFGVGENNIYIVFGATDNDVDVQALVMAVCASGIVNTMRAVRIIDAEEGKRAAEKASAILYSPPGS
tara:strand:- start:3867 stop:4196 length:330 start_codon:yes stop_codon:yes gene_type:complete